MVWSEVRDECGECLGWVVGNEELGVEFVVWDDVDGFGNFFDGFVCVGCGVEKFF